MAGFKAGEETLAEFGSGQSRRNRISGYQRVPGSTLETDKRSETLTPIKMKMRPMQIKKEIEGRLCKGFKSERFSVLQ